MLELVRKRDLLHNLQEAKVKASGDLTRRGMGVLGDEPAAEFDLNFESFETAKTIAAKEGLTDADSAIEKAERILEHIGPGVEGNNTTYLRLQIQADCPFEIEDCTAVFGSISTLAQTLEHVAGRYEDSIPTFSQDLNRVSDQTSPPGWVSFATYDQQGVYPIPIIRKATVRWREALSKHGDLDSDIDLHIQDREVLTDIRLLREQCGSISAAVYDRQGIFNRHTDLDVNWSDAKRTVQGGEQLISEL